MFNKNKSSNVAVEDKKPLDKKVRCSYGLMGLGQILNGQIAKGVIYILIEIAFILFMVFFGFNSVINFFTLGTVTADPWQGIQGDNSITMLIMSLFTFILIAIYVFIYLGNVKDAKVTCELIEKGKTPPKFYEELKELLDKKFHKTALLIPIIGVSIFNILPIIFMTLIAFTNYGGDIVPPTLVDWTGFASFVKVFSVGELAPTFGKILGWNIIWAIISTILNYFGGLALALLYNKKCVKGKAIWRGFAILAYAIPGFITLIGFKFMFSYGGPINNIIVNSGGTAIGFLGIDGGIKTKIIGIAVNAWISIPTSMLLATGILSNMNTDLYEAARIDGASSFRQFLHLTLPFVLFATMPVLITQFIGNFNNFGIFYFLRNGLIMDGYFLANDTDLLINWLFNLSLNNNYYSIGAAISLIIFIITSAISLTVYLLSPSYKQEDTFR